MTAEGRLLRGKENFDSNRFLKNPETLAYMATLEAPKGEPEATLEPVNPTGFPCSKEGCEFKAKSKTGLATHKRSH